MLHLVVIFGFFGFLNIISMHPRKTRLFSCHFYDYIPGHNYIERSSFESSWLTHMRISPGMLNLVHESRGSVERDMARL